MSFDEDLRNYPSSDIPGEIASRIVAGGGMGLALRGDANIYSTDTGAVNAYEVGFNPAFGSYTTGMRVLLSPANTNTTASTLDVDSLGGKSILKADGTALVGGEIREGILTELVYDGTQFLIAGTQYVQTYGGDPKYIVIPSEPIGIGATTTLAFTTGDSGYVHGRRLYVPYSITTAKVVVTWSAIAGTGTRELWYGMYNSLGTELFTSAKISLAGSSNYNEQTLVYSVRPGHYCIAYALILTGSAGATIRVHQVDSIGQGLNTQTVKNYFLASTTATTSAMPSTLGTMSDPSNNQSKSLPMFLLFA